MGAFATDRFGQAGSIREPPDPEPGEGEVPIWVKAAASRHVHGKLAVVLS